MDPQAAVVAGQVKDYLQRHPRAADTRDGIAGWWLPDGLCRRPQALQDALDHLVATGFLKARRLPSGDLLYSAAPDNQGARPE